MAQTGVHDMSHAFEITQSSEPDRLQIRFEDRHFGSFAMQGVNRVGSRRDADNLPLHFVFPPASEPDVRAAVDAAVARIARAAAANEAAIAAQAAAESKAAAKAARAALRAASPAVRKPRKAAAPKRTGYVELSDWDAEDLSDSGMTSRIGQSANQVRDEIGRNRRAS
jgi:hypothetical protein